MGDLTGTQWLNLIVATAGALVAMGAINRMSRETECTIIASFVTVGAGLIGYALGTVLPGRWQHTMDTVLLGGIVALLVGTRRHTIWINPALMPRISACVSIATWAYFLWNIQ
jgi:hypothetical protein